MGWLLIPLILFAEIVTAFALWRLILWDLYQRVGFQPLVAAYCLFLVGLFVSVIASGGLPVLVWFLLFAPPIALLPLSIICVPLAAFLVRTGRVSYGLAAALVVLFVFAGALVIYAWSPGAFDGFGSALGQSAIFVIPGGGLFAFGLVAALKGQRPPGPSDEREEEPVKNEFAIPQRWWRWTDASQGRVPAQDRDQLDAVPPVT